MSIELNNVSYRINQKSLVKNINFKITPGELHVLLGQNGAGKSTIFKLLCGDIKPTSGSVQMHGKDLRDWSPKDLSLIRSVLTQDYELNFPFLVSEVVELGRIQFPFEKEKNSIAVNETLHLTDMNHFKNRDYSSLSGGEKQRTQYARVLSQIWDEPYKYLLLDEPTAGMDLANQIRLLEISAEMANKGYGVMLILHDLNSAYQYADRITFIKEGRIFVSGSPKELIDPDLLKQIYGVNLEVIWTEQGIFFIPKNKMKETNYERSFS